MNYGSFIWPDRRKVMENWLLILVGVIFLVGIVAGAVRGFVKIGISLLSTVLIAALLHFLSPHVGSALAKLYAPR